MNEIPFKRPKTSETRVPVTEGWKIKIGNTSKRRRRSERENDGLGSPSRMPRPSY